MFSASDLKTIDEMWKNFLTYPTACVCCYVCGGGIAAHCPCSKQSFYNSITLRDVANYQNNKPKAVVKKEIIVPPCGHYSTCTCYLHK